MVVYMKSSRQNEILQLLKQDKIINTAGLAAQFGVSVETIRRDLNQLERSGLMKKVYGGAQLAQDSAVPWPALSVRLQSNQTAKASIAARAIEFISDSCVIALDAGTTIYELCRHLPARHDMTVICSDIHCASYLLDNSTARVYMMGGFLTPDGTSRGTFSGEFFANISEIDTFVCSTDGVDPVNGLTTNGMGINELKRRYIQKAARCILLADHSKFDQKGFYRVCGLSDIDLLITDRETPPDIIELIRDCGVEVIVTE